MTAPFSHVKLTCRLLLVAGLSFALPAALHAQPALTPSAAATASPAVPPPVPLLKSPVDQFRQLLALPIAERESRLTNRPPELRKRILAKIQEYEAMKPDERELRLRGTQLQWYLLVLREMPLDGRATQLAMVPDADRPLVKDHLDQWDHLSVEVQKQILKYQKAMENLATQGFTNTIIPPAPPSNSPTDALKNLEGFLNLPSAEREELYANFQKFFELSDDEKQTTLGVLPQQDRLQMTMVLRNFAKLPKPQRDQCFNSFAKFSKMSDSERQEFLRNAERWREMTVAERAAWRELVKNLAPRPPIPPGLIPPPPTPPMPMPPVRAHQAALQVSLPLTNN